MSILIGTASWTDPGFIEDWYPKGMKRDDMLPWYAGHFNMVEVNSTFYGAPKASTVEKWVAQTPTDFIFDIKLPKLFSWHQQEYVALPPEVRSAAQVDARGNVARTPSLVDALAQYTEEALQPLAQAGKLGVLLLQLSPAFSPRRNQLSEIAPIIQAFSTPVAVEFRNHDWLLDEQLEDSLGFLSQAGAIFVNLDAPVGPHFTMMPKVSAITNPAVAYLRAHGRNAEGYLKGRSVAERFDYEYDTAELEEIRSRVLELEKQAGRVHVVFNNNRSNYAPKAAEQLKRITA
jgi:uncharacterized protein YecE (DUF72 family)